MTYEKQQELYKRYPYLYASKNISLMRFGFCIGDGWYDLVDKLSSKLEAIVLTFPEEGRPSAFQVKEKYGGLRFYMSSSTSETDSVIREAEQLSYHICEDCGSTGILHQDTPTGWWKTLCEDCMKQRRTKSA